MIKAGKGATETCKQSGNIVGNHFTDAGKMVKLGPDASAAVKDYSLSHFACYLIAQNGDSRKPEIAKELSSQ